MTLSCGEAAITAKLFVANPVSDLRPENHRSGAGETHSNLQNAFG
jgi:hypothetical protein